MLRRCLIKIDGQRYEGQYPSTAAAVADAMARYPHARAASARRLP